MKKVLLITFLMLSSLGYVNAQVTVEQASEPEYLINSGYSEVTAEEVLNLKNRANGKPVEPLYEKNYSKPVTFLRRVYAYIDPAQDSEDRLHHNIKMSPSYTDL